MTKDADLKRLVRERMARTGENYTTARAALTAVPPATRPPATTSPEPVSVTTAAVARAERDRVLRRVMPGGRLVDIPARRRTRAVVLLELALLFTPGEQVPEVEVNRRLSAAHPDVASLRRNLVEYGYLTREDSVYRLCERLPRRDANQAQEVPAWERDLLRAHGVGL